MRNRTSVRTGSLQESNSMTGPCRVLEIAKIIIHLKYEL